MASFMYSSIHAYNFRVPREPDPEVDLYWNHDGPKVDDYHGYYNAPKEIQELSAGGEGFWTNEEEDMVADWLGISKVIDEYESWNY